MPPECLLLTMQQNQKVLCAERSCGKLTNRFLLVSNIDATDGGDAIRAGNARVVRARLADAKFFTTRTASKRSRAAWRGWQTSSITASWARSCSACSVSSR